jgi:hypothetical protein
LRLRVVLAKAGQLLSFPRKSADDPALFPA